MRDYSRAIAREATAIFSRDAIARYYFQQNSVREKNSRSRSRRGLSATEFQKIRDAILVINTSFQINLTRVFVHFVVQKQP